ncbi:D-amino acid aminotransferase [Parasulfuritortus cantonensis]|uniref:D-amino acid aminotransferase n=1 Tax=Parasulfuritortus cantonensis TaxID=2528202 RepID=A0A4V2NVA8_9PROT|nr:D-amino acid aminotransferase [Parasulfuritortus cantonensis]TCJ12776.1 D-amino acid aminotransferase [Parasulfuritortus cantonensis]
MSDLVYLNGDYLPLAEAKIPVLDRGFIFGDGVYEVIPVYDRRPFRMADHLDRLRRSLAGIRLADPYGDAEWQALFAPLIEAADWPDQGIYIQVTRGPAPRDHAFPKDVRPTVFIMAMQLSAPPPEVVEHGVAAITAEDNRWLRCDLKAVSLLANVLLRQLSVDRGCAETVLIRSGHLTEGSASSIFVVRDGVIMAPPHDNLVLPGITYDVVVELAGQAGLPVALRPVTEAELRGADEIWLTSSTKEITAVTRLDGQPVGDGRPGPLFRRLHAAYQVYKHQVMRGRAGDTP